MRSTLVALALSVCASAPLTAQWTVTTQIGVHADRLRPPQRILTEDGSSTVMFSAPGEAPVIGIRVARSIRPQFSIDVGVAVSQNQSWSGGGAVPLPDFVKRTAFSSATLLFRPLDPESSLQVHLSVGPAAIFHGGSGESVLTREIDVGFAGAAGASFAIGDRMTLGLDVQNYVFASEFGEVDFAGAGFPADYQPGTRWRSEWLVLPSLRIRF